MKDTSKIIREEARLIILKGLAEEPSETLSSSMLEVLLKTYGIRRDREWIHAELDWLEEKGTITLKQAGTVKIATLTERGARHLDRSFVVEGIKRPSRME